MGGLIKKFRLIRSLKKCLLESKDSLLKDKQGRQYINENSFLECFVGSGLNVYINENKSLLIELESEKVVTRRLKCEIEEELITRGSVVMSVPNMFDQNKDLTMMIALIKQDYSNLLNLIERFLNLFPRITTLILLMFSAIIGAETLNHIKNWFQDVLLSLITRFI
jgi:site-specific DNA-adenine methylase